MGVAWTVVCFAGTEWRAHPQRPQWLMTALAEFGAEVIFVENIGTRSPGLRDIRRVARRVAYWVRSSLRPGDGAPAGGDEIPRQPHIDSPIVLPNQHLRVIRALGRATLTRRMRRLTRGGRPLVIWTYLPMPVIGDVARELAADALVYDWADDAAAHVLSPSPAVRERLAAWEDEMIARADLVFVASAELLRRRGSSNPNTHVLGHGTPIVRSPASAPLSVSAMPAPRVGFVGTITAWTDLELLEGIARARPEWSLILVGPASVRLRTLRRLPNVLITGQRPHNEIPSILSLIDVGIIPYRIEPAIEVASPVKLHEYLAAGLPVVSVDIPEVRLDADAVEVASGVDGFVAAIERNLGRSRRPRAGHSTWHDRAAEMVEIVEATLAASGPGDPDPEV
jgi:glycosyltransferase involved in cell wall biosynthesis